MFFYLKPIYELLDILTEFYEACKLESLFLFCFLSLFFGCVLSLFHFLKMLTKYNFVKKLSTCLHSRLLGNQGTEAKISKEKIRGLLISFPSSHAQTTHSGAHFQSNSWK